MWDTTESGAPVRTSPESEVERLAREVAELREARAADRVELEAVRAQVMGQHASPHPDAALGQRDPSSKRRLGRRRPTGAEEGEPSGLVSRRRLFGLLGGAAAAGAGLAVAGSTMGPDRADAANGDNLVIGQTNIGGTTTELDASVGTQPTLTVKNTSATNGATAIYAEAAFHDAVVGICDGNNVAIAGACSGNGTALYGQTAGGGTNSGAQLWLHPGTSAGAPTGGFHTPGELWMDSNAQLWQCTSGPPPGTWVKLSSPLVSIPPARVYDSRVGQSPTTGPKSQITNGNTVSVDVTGTQATPPGGPSGVPTGAKSVLGNITVVNGPNPVFLTVFAEGATPPATSNVNANGGQVIANSFTSQLGTSNGISIKCGGGPTDFIIDIFGYYP